MIGLVSSGLRGAAKIAQAILKCSADVARQGVETAGSVTATPVVHAVQMAHGAAQQMMNIPGVSGAMQSLNVPATAAAAPRADSIASLTLPPANLKDASSI